jgi:hypothetical protein
MTLVQTLKNIYQEKARKRTSYRPKSTPLPTLTTTSSDGTIKMIQQIRATSPIAGNG